MCIYSSMFKLQSPSKYSPFDVLHLLRHFFHCSKRFLNLLIVVPFSVCAVFCFTSSTSAKHLPLRTFFYLGNKQKMLLGAKSGEQKRLRRGSCHFWSKTAEHWMWCGWLCSSVTYHEISKPLEYSKKVT